MNKSIFIGILFSVVTLFVAGSLSFIQVAPLKYTIQKKDTGTGFAVLELFTSEGCSSCPAADALVAKISKEYKDKIIVLGFHVDYWNRLGWKDSFSNAEYSNRQQAYRNIFHLNSIYTPQVVVNGKKELVGSNESGIRKIITEEVNLAQHAILIINARDKDTKTVSISYKVEEITGVILNIALVQSYAETYVRSGENSGSVLHHINIVRDFKTAELSNAMMGDIRLEYPKGLSANNCSIIAYVQDTNNFEVKAKAASKIEIE